jgi:hypothetical protein
MQNRRSQLPCRRSVNRQGGRWHDAIAIGAFPGVDGPRIKARAWPRTALVRAVNSGTAKAEKRFPLFLETL